MCSPCEQDCPSREPYVPRRRADEPVMSDPLLDLGCTWRQVGVGFVGLGLEAVSYTHLTLPTILRV